MKFYLIMIITILFLFPFLSFAAIETNKPVTLGFVGDIMLDRGVETSVNKNFDGNFNKLFENLSFLKDYDILFGNLEGPISDKGERSGSKFSFQMQPLVASALADAGFDIVSIANNHIGDYSTIALIDTLVNLQKARVAYTGAGLIQSDVVMPKIIEKNGLKIGFLAFSDVGPNWLEAKENSPGTLIVRDNFEKIIKAAASRVNVLIVSIHFGNEYKPHNKRQEFLARGAIDSGAKIIIGHHPHIIQATEKYKDGFIAYSLGNFIFDQHFSDETMQGLLLSLKISRNIFSQRVEVFGIDKKIIKLNKNFQPEEIFDYKELSCPSGNSNRDLTLFNISQQIGIGNYVPKDLIPTENKTCLRRQVAQNFKALKKAAYAQKLNIIVTSGFRDYNHQKTVFNNLKNENIAGVALAVAPPEHSEHQLGTTIDILTPDLSAATKDLFANTKEYDWLINNAYKFGFILSYPADKENITGYKFEPWHWRYVGLNLAKIAKEKNLSAQELLADLNIQNSLNNK